MTFEELFNTPEAADFLRAKPQTLEAWRTRGGGPRYVRIGRNIRYRKADLLEYIESRLERSTSERGIRP